jgi:hypothetical protein
LNGFLRFDTKLFKDRQARVRFAREAAVEAAESGFEQGMLRADERNYSEERRKAAEWEEIECAHTPGGRRLDVEGDPRA